MFDLRRPKTNAQRLLILMLVVSLNLIDVVGGKVSPHYSPTQPARDARQAGLDARSALRGDFGALPLSFEPNEGQTDGRVKFLARGGSYVLFLTAEDHCQE